MKKCKLDSYDNFIIINDDDFFTIKFHRTYPILHKV